MQTEKAMTKKNNDKEENKKEKSTKNNHGVFGPAASWQTLRISIPILNIQLVPFRCFYCGNLFTWFGDAVKIFVDSHYAKRYYRYIIHVSYKCVRNNILLLLGTFQMKY